jgi:hypothetical protein
VTGIGAGEAEISAVYQGVAGMAHLSVMPPIVTPPSCSFVLSIGSSIEGYPNGGSFDVTVTAPNGCAWSVVSTASWIHVPASIVGSGTGMFAFTVDANTGTARTATLVIAGRTVTFNQTAPPPPPPAPQPTFAGIRYDNIQLAHSFIVGSPVPTQNQAATYCCWPLPVTRSGSFTFNLADYPLNVLPSGGSSNIASASEMMFAAINVSPASTVITFQWHKAVNQDTVIYAYSTGSAYAWAYSFIGHFSWEISEPGAYYLIIGTLSGSARMDFVVTGPSSTLTARQGGRPPITVLSGFEGGGGGAGRD